LVKLRTFTWCGFSFSLLVFRIAVATLVAVTVSCSASIVLAFSLTCVMQRALSTSTLGGAFTSLQGAFAAPRAP
jgi:hypothetical protein